MTQATLIQLAKQGDPEAIAVLMNASLQEIGAHARVTLKDSCLHVLLEAEKSLDSASCVEFVCIGLEQLEIETISTVILYGRITGQPTAEWVERIDLSWLDEDLAELDQELVETEATGDLWNGLPAANAKFQESNSGSQELGTPSVISQQPEAEIQPEAETQQTVSVEANEANENQTRHHDATLTDVKSRELKATADVASKQQELRKQALENQIGESQKIQNDLKQVESQALRVERSDINYLDLKHSASPRVAQSPQVSSRLPIANRGRLGAIAQQKRLRSLAILGIPLAILVGSWQIWQRYLAHEQKFSPAPQSQAVANSPMNKAAVPAADPFTAAVAYATKAVDLGRTAQTSGDWSNAANSWQQAIALMQAVPESHPKRALAQQRIVEYQRNLKQITETKLVNANGNLKVVKLIKGAIAPKSITFNGTDQFLVPQGGDTHTISVYNRNFKLVKTFFDRVRLSKYGYAKFEGAQQGAPRAAVIAAGDVWVANEQMRGMGLQKVELDNCRPEGRHSPGFVYQLRGRQLRLQQIGQVGAAPLAIAATPDGRYVLTSNWCSWDISVVDAKTVREVRRLQVGSYPRGLAIDSQAQTAYVAVSGTDRIGIINLKDFSLDWLEQVGRSPYQLALSADGKWLYAILSGDGQLVKIDLANRQVLNRVNTGNLPRSLTLSSNSNFAYVANYDANTVSKVRTDTMQIVETVKVPPQPLGTTYDPKTRQLWVACASGSIVVLQD